MDQLVLKAAARKESGKSAVQKLRGAGSIPAVMYNSKGEAVMLSVNEDAFTKVWKAATPTTLINLEVDGKKYLAFIKDTQYDILSDSNRHVDFHVIEEDKLLKVTVQLQVTGNPAGVREGGYLIKGNSAIKIECMPKDLPVRITADISDLSLGSSYCVKDVPLSKGVKLLSDADAVVASVKAVS